MIAERHEADLVLAQLRDKLEVKRWELMAAIAVQIPLALTPLENEIALTGVIGH